MKSYKFKMKNSNFLGNIDVVKRNSSEFEMLDDKHGRYEGTVSIEGIKFGFKFVENTGYIMIDVISKPWYYTRSMIEEGMNKYFTS